MTKTVEEIKDLNPNKNIEVFVDGKRVNSSDFLAEFPTSIKETESTISVFFETE